ncbi:hypothetical protein F4860DRAFT_460056 [Xylaria cubensis]|nr:hypothetical protein F4860DRAFT_460056 [Xylaria cubensis]
MVLLDSPSEADIDQLLILLPISRAEAINRLKANSNNVEAATNEYFDNPKGAKEQWDESHFNTDREGETNATGITFNIQGADELPSVGHVQNAAPTRPPSRANNRSPLGPASAAEEDADLARALAESAADSGITPQEVGVIDHQTNSKHFGPANRSEYDTEMWAMVSTKPDSRTEAADPPPSNRKRDIDAPAFLRQENSYRIGSILSIYNQIPMARNFLLRCGKPAPTYGHNSEWWKGKPILRHDVLAKLATEADIWDDDAHPDFVEELHRLMAFLDKSDRSYASVDSLAQTKAIDESYGSWIPDVEDRLFQALHGASSHSPDCGIEQMTTTGKIMSVMPEPEGPNEEEESTTSFIFLDIVLDFDGYSWVDTLYDALDHLLWSSALSLDYTFPEDAKTAVLLKPAEVLTMRLGGVGLAKPCDIPAVFYADRYMNSRKELSLHFQTQIREIKKALKKVAWTEAERTKCTGQICSFSVQGFDQEHDVHGCCRKMIEYAEHLLERQNKAVQWRQFQDQWRSGTPYSMDDLRLLHTWSGPSHFTDAEKADQERWKHIIKVCKEKIEEAGLALNACKQKREELHGHLDVVKTRLTCEAHEVDDRHYVFRSDLDACHPEYWDPSIQYSLRGVATTSEVAYVCVRDVDGPSNPGESSVAKDQWWKIGYVQSDASPIKSEKVTLDDVLQAAGTESKNPILIYASETALTQEPIPLSDALRMFVKADNRSFQQELAQEERLQKAKNLIQESQTQDQPVTEITAVSLAQLPDWPRGKRKHSVGSSVATNGSVRSDLADVELAFDDSQKVDHDLPKPTHQDSGPQSSKSGEIVESLSETKSREYEAPGYDEKERDKHQDHSRGDDAKSDANNTSTSKSDVNNISTSKKSDVNNASTSKKPDANNTSTSKKPEMSERKGGLNPFLVRAGPSAQNPTDMMDLDTEHGPGDG